MTSITALVALLLIQNEFQPSPGIFPQTEPEIGEGLEHFSQALGDTFTWSDENQTQFVGTRWQGGKIELSGFNLPEDPFQYASEALSQSSKQSCTFTGPNYEVAYEGVNAGAFPVQCGNNIFLFSFITTYGSMELHYFRRDGRTMATASFDERRGIRELFVTMDQVASNLSLTEHVPLLVEDQRWRPEMAD